MGKRLLYDVIKAAFEAAKRNVVFAASLYVRICSVIW
jgi:hypothetical protein